MSLDPVYETPLPEQRDEVAEMIEKYADPERAGEEIRIWATRDGLTTPTGVLRAGEEFVALHGSRLWGLTLDPSSGRSWLDMDTETQAKRFGRVMFRKGHKPAEFVRPLDELERLEHRAVRPPSDPLEASLYRELDRERDGARDRPKQTIKNRTISQQV